MNASHPSSSAASPEQALAIYRDLLREMVAEMAEATSNLPAGYERLCTGLESFWEALFARRRLRGQLQASETPETAEVIDRISRPFNHLLYSELLNSGCNDAAQQVSPLIDDVRSIARAELRSGRRARQRRQQLLQRVGAHCGA